MGTSVLEHELTQAFGRHGVAIASMELRSYPGEINAIVFVDEGSYARALEAAEEIEASYDDDEGLLIIVRRARAHDTSDTEQPDRRGVHSRVANDLVSLISARNRVSEVQPSLSYVKDLTANITTVTTARHHLIFGRRGAGKSTLMVEAKRIVEDRGDVTAWINLQTLRREDSSRIFLRVARAMIEELLARASQERISARPVTELGSVYDRLGALIAKDNLSADEASRLIPDVQHAIKRALELLGVQLFVFVDDFYYVPRADQPELLDVLHGCVRDCQAWLKIASIRHLTRWFTSNPPRGLQTGQDADIIDLDVTLEDPLKARAFLTDILFQYATEAGSRHLGSLFRAEALNRLVLASGGVPRDFLVLAAAGISKARTRENARLVGVQDINQVAGDAADAKIQELEEDLAANAGASSQALDALTKLRTFCLTDKSTTFYAVDFRDKETHPKEYAVFTDLQDLRLVHLIHRAVSSPHDAGQKTEVFILDLSQYTGSRLKQGLRVFDLEEDAIVVKTTRSSKTKDRRAKSSREVLTLLRTAPVLELETFTDLTS